MTATLTATPFYSLNIGDTFDYRSPHSKEPKRYRKVSHNTWSSAVDATDPNATARFGIGIKGDAKVWNVTENNGTDSHIIGRTLKANSLFAAVAEVREIAGKCTEKGYRNFADCVYVNVSEDGVFRAICHHFHNVSFSRYSHSSGNYFSVFEEKQGNQIFNERDGAVVDLVLWCVKNGIKIKKSIEEIREEVRREMAA